VTRAHVHVRRDGAPGQTSARRCSAPALIPDVGSITSRVSRGIVDSITPSRAVLWRWPAGDLWLRLHRCDSAA